MHPLFESPSSLRQYIQFLMPKCCTGKKISQASNYITINLCYSSVYFSKNAVLCLEFYCTGENIHERTSALSEGDGERRNFPDSLLQLTKLPPPLFWRLPLEQLFGIRTWRGRTGTCVPLCLSKQENTTESKAFCSQQTSSLWEDFARCNPLHY